MREEREIFYGVPESACTEGDDDEGEEDDPTTPFVAEGEGQEKECREGREEEDWHLGSDGAERMREAFPGQVFRCEHDEKNDKEKGVAGEMRMVFAGSDSHHEELPRLSEEKEEAGEEEGADDGIEYRIGCVIVTEILIADEIILDEGEAKCFRERTEEVSMVDDR